jgi:DNA adenine methylase
MSNYFKSPISWYGGKYYMAKDIIGLFPEHKLYVEGFGGAGHVLFRKYPSNMEVYNDIHSGLYLLFKYLREGNKDLIRHIQLTPYSREEFLNSKDWYKEVDELEKVRKFYVRTMQSVNNNGGWSYSKSHSRRGMCANVSRWLGNVEDNLVNIVERLREVCIENLDITDLLVKYDSPDTLFYLDPPYVQETRRQKISYDHEMSLDMYEQLVNKLLRIKGKVVLSGYEHKVFSKLLDSGWSKHLLGQYVKHSQKLTIHSDKAQEFIWLNFKL